MGDSPASPLLAESTPFGGHLTSTVLALPCILVDHDSLPLSLVEVQWNITLTAVPSTGYGNKPITSRGKGTSSGFLFGVVGGQLFRFVQDKANRLPDPVQNVHARLDHVNPGF